MLALLASLLLSAPAPADAAVRPLPLLGRDLKVDGDLRDLAPATELKAPPSARGASADVGVKAAFRRDALVLGVTVRDDQVLEADQLDLTLFFPGAGTTARGVVFRFGKEGLRPAPAEVAAPAWAQALLASAVKVDGKGFSLELLVPARALPRFPAARPLLLSVCADYADADAAGGEPALVTTCPSGTMAGGPTRLPDELRRVLRLNPSAEVEGLEAREHGWVGYSKLHYAAWAEGDAPLTPASLGELVLGEAAIEPEKVALPIPARLLLPDNRPIFTVLSGQNPHSGRDGCADGAELRMAMYVVHGVTADRVLEWPAATCKLGRAMRFELTADGNLTIGYTNGSTAHFTWTSDHFERSELGVAP